MSLEVRLSGFSALDVNASEFFAMLNSDAFWVSPKPNEPESMSLRREAATPAQTVGAYLNV